MKPEVERPSERNHPQHGYEHDPPLTFLLSLKAIIKRFSATILRIAIVRIGDPFVGLRSTQRQDKEGRCEVNSPFCPFMPLTQNRVPWQPLDPGGGSTKGSPINQQHHQWAATGTR